ncbi:MAG: ABC transporter substrate-binding protein/permease [Eubacteriales bacterium]|nr:ABC transporter substrate-binding protein/permease [Eubacteriales bacterium]
MLRSKIPLVEKLLLFLAVSLFACSLYTGAAAFSELDELEDKRIGVTTGSIQALQAEERFPNAQLFYFSTSIDMLNALRTNKIDAYADADALVKYMMAENPDLTNIDEKLSDGMKAGAIFPKTEQGKKLCDEFSGFVREIKASGVYDEIQETWFGEDEDKRAAQDFRDLPGPNGRLRMAADPTMIPFVFVKDGDPAGIDIDTVCLFCREYGYSLEFVPMDFAGILPAIISGKCDFACGGIAYTAERAESVLFAEPTFEGGSVLAVLKEEEAAEKGFWASLASSFEKTFLREDRWKLFVTGSLNTLLITLFSMLFGTLLGFLVYLLCRGGNRAANTVTGICVWLVQGMPVVVLLMVLYYVVFGRFRISGLWVSVIGFTLVFGSAMYGMLCSGVAAVDKGQTEAAYALGYSDRKTFFRIILPQAAFHFMPVYRAEAVSLVKGTAVVGYIAVRDLTKMADIVRSRTYEAFFPLIAVTVIYFLISAVFKLVIGVFTRQVDPKNRTPEQILKGIKTED